MPKKPVSLTLEADNLLWLKGRARLVAGGSISEAIDQIVVEARSGRLGATTPSRSVVGTIDLPGDLPLADADDAIRGLFAESLSRPFGVHEDPATQEVGRRRLTKSRRKPRG